MDKENCTASDVLADLFGPTCTMDSPPKKGKRRGGGRYDDSKCSPPKITKKSIEKRIPLSPSKHNIDEGFHGDESESLAKTVAKKNLFGCDVKVATPKKSRTKTNEDFAKIKARLSLENPGVILGREKEQAEVEEFIKDSITEERPRSMYISGQPGTGKSASINNILGSIDFDELGARNVFINCMSVENSATIYASLLERFGYDQPVPKTVRWQKSKFEQFIHNEETPMCILVLDEMDQLNSKNEKVLYDLFNLAGDDSRLVIIGIANGLDLLERVLPNLAKDKRPRKVNFQPYTTAQIETLIKERLDINLMKKFHPMAIKMCAKKVSALAGDARKALDVLRRATEIAGIEQVDQVSLKHVTEVMNKTYSDRSGAELPFCQQMAIISMIRLAREEKLQVTMAVIIKKYKEIAKSKKLPIEQDTDFKEAIELLIQAAMITKIEKPKKVMRYELAMNEEDAAVKLGQKSKAILHLVE